MVRREEPPKKFNNHKSRINERKCYNCGETVFKRFYSKQEGKFVTSTMPFTCSYCGKEFCVYCRIPENHRCAGGVTYNKWFEREVPPYKKPL
ncbi:MAG: AN1-type zinc finger protein, partial [Candidatus Methanoperedens sp.]|nr:AN1-type zinc finger protein [Candidatus Methanoperedens sp.]